MQNGRTGVEVTKRSPTTYEKSVLWWVSS